ncbi:MAG: LLM class flavin-dependent oxidoreductase, partial [Reyranellaceae bacterium]
MRRLEFGWFVPTSGDTDAYGHAEAFIPPSMAMFERVTRAAEAAGFEYILIPVQTACWEAWITSAMLVARTQSIKPLVAARPGYINPALLAKMIAAFDQLSGGRVCINLIAGASDEEAAADGIQYAKEQRYALMDEEVTLLKTLWSTTGRVDFDGAFHKLKGALIVPKPLQKPWPPFYLGGGSRQAWEISAKHSDVHLFWGDTPERIGRQIAEIRELARKHGRHDAIGFGMRLQVIVREREADAWAAADRLIADLGER